jgi:hypothetical protein
MKKFCVLAVAACLALSLSCQKQQTEEEKNAEVERQVQQRLAAEHQAQEQQQLAQQQTELNAREKALAEKENAARESPTAPLERPPTRENGERRGTASYGTFYTKLEPYGTWRETGDYGYVWQPREAEESVNWRPYTNGRWVYTDAGWTWVSDESFGWATYHYGRWTRLGHVGWVWVPGDEWAPAWVSWRKSNDYVGWAPLPPEARFDRRTGIHNWADSYYDIGPDQYAFVPVNEFGANRIDRTVVPRERNVAIVNQTTNVTNITYSNTTVINQGPDYEELRGRSREPLQRFRLERETGFNINIEVPRSVVRGDAIVIAAPIIAAPQPAERPRRVKETIAQVVIDRGWEGISDRQAAETTRQKMKSEATPPANAPPKKFVKPVMAANTSPAAAPSSSPESAVPSPSPSASPIASATASPPTGSSPLEKPSPTSSVTARPTSRVTPVERTESSATATPVRKRPGPLFTPPAAKTSPTTSPAATAVSRPAASAIPKPSATPIETPPSKPTPTATATGVESVISPTPVSSPTVNAATGRGSEVERLMRAQRAIDQAQKTEEQRKLKGQGKAKARESQSSVTAPPSAAPVTSPEATTSATREQGAAASPSVSPADHFGREKKKDKRQKQGAEETASPTPSTIPQ